MNFRYVPIDSATTDRFRRTGVDDGGNPFRQMTADLQFKWGEFALRQCGKIEHHKFRSFCLRCRNLSGLTMISTS